MAQVWLTHIAKLPNLRQRNLSCNSTNGTEKLAPTWGVVTIQRSKGKNIIIME